VQQRDDREERDERQRIERHGCGPPSLARRAAGLAPAGDGSLHGEAALRQSGKKWRNLAIFAFPLKREADLHN